MQPILHLSIPVRDLAEARQFYVETLGCEAGRSRDAFQDVWFFGLQLTLQDEPGLVTRAGASGAQHFGVTLSRQEFDAVVERVNTHGVAWVVAVATDGEGTLMEQTKAKLADPSGNVIELKTYVDIMSALELTPHSYPAAVRHGN